MKMVKCSNIGISNCNYIALGDDLEEVEKNMLTHIESEHKDLLEGMGEDEKHALNRRVSTFLGRSCGCGNLEMP